MKKLFVAAMMVALTACSSAPKQLQINFMPQSTISENPVVNNVPVNLTSKDLRSAQYVALIDSGRNNLEPVQSRQNVRITLESALYEQLISQGYKVTANSPNHVSLDIQKILVNVKHSMISNEMNAEVILQVTAESPQGKLVKTFTGTANKSGLLSVNEKDIETVVNDVTNLVLKEMANDTELVDYMKEHF